MESSIFTVVVLPLVPVTTSQGADRPSGPASRSRQASSTSPHTGTPRAAACVSSGASGRKPGEVTSRSTSSGSVAVAPGLEPDVGPQDPQQLGLLALLVGARLGQRGDGGAEVGEVVGGGEPGGAEAGDDGADAVPGVVPAVGGDVDH